MYTCLTTLFFQGAKLQELDGKCNSRPNSFRSSTLSYEGSGRRSKRNCIIESRSATVRTRLLDEEVEESPRELVYTDKEEEKEKKAVIEFSNDEDNNLLHKDKTNYHSFV